MRTQGSLKKEVKFLPALQDIPTNPPACFPRAARPNFAPRTLPDRDGHIKTKASIISGDIAETSQGVSR